MPKATLYEFVANIRAAVVIAAPDRLTAEEQIKNWGVGNWMADGETLGVNDVELVDIRETEYSDIFDDAHIDATKEAALCQEK